MRLAVLMTIIAVVLSGAAATAGPLSGRFAVGTGYLDNPLGISNDRPAGYLEQSLRLAASFGPKPAPDALTNSVFKLGYEGNLSEFGNETYLGSMRHGLGLEWFRAKRVGAKDQRSNSISAGAQFSLRRYQDYYRIYDHDVAYSYLAFRHFTGPQLWSGYAALRMRRYSELPEESSLEPHGQLKLQRFFASRTTLGLSARYGVKIYNDSAASVIWDTPSLPSTSQMAARLNIAQGLSDRLSLRGRVDSRWTLSDFPYYVAEDVFDSPLLDGYAHDGWDLMAGVKWLGPAQIWTEVVASRGEHDYGSLLFATSPSGETRDDVVREYYFTMEKSLSGKSRGPKLKLAGGWRDQTSSLAAYDYDGVFGSSTLSWQF